MHEFVFLCFVKRSRGRFVYAGGWWLRYVLMARSRSHCGTSGSDRSPVSQVAQKRAREQAQDRRSLRRARIAPAKSAWIVERFAAKSTVNLTSTGHRCSVSGKGCIRRFIVYAYLQLHTFVNCIFIVKEGK